MVTSGPLSRLGQQRRNRVLQFLRCRNPFRKGDADDPFLIADIEAFRIEADRAPLIAAAAMGASELLRQMRLRAFDFGEHFGFIRDERARAFERCQKLLRGKIGSAPEAAVQMRRLDRDTKEAEIGEIGIDARFRMPREKTRAQGKPLVFIACPFGTADNRETRMRQRIAAARRIEGRIKQQGKPQISVKMPRMRGEPRQK